MMLTPSSVVEGSEALPEVHGEITFKNVSFRYINDSNHILNQLSFTVKPNKFVAIIGKSGIGKTTILNLIFRLYDPREGVVELDGKDLKSLNFNFRKHITFVSQHPYLFNGTVMENLKFGNPSCTDEEVIELTKKLHLHEIIENLPGKYKENVG
jgi:ATP-binding cassette subfamily B protein